MCIKKLIFAGIVLTFSMISLQAADNNGSDTLPKPPKKRAVLDEVLTRTPLDTKLDGIYQISSGYGTDDYDTDDDVKFDKIDVGSIVINGESSSQELIPIVKRLTTSNPDEVYHNSFLSSDNITGDVYILDFHGMLINEANPQKFKMGQQLTPRGNAISNVRFLIKNGATVILCSAWDKIDETITQMLNAGFTKEDLGIVDEQVKPEARTQEITLSNGKKININYMKYGRVISTRISLFYYSDIFYRNKAFSPFLYEGFNIDSVKRIHFLDDSKYNCDIFQNNVEYYGMYPGKEVRVYEVKSPEVISPEITSHTPELPENVNSSILDYSTSGEAGASNILNSTPQQQTQGVEID